MNWTKSDEKQWRSAARCDAEIGKALAGLSTAALVRLAGFGGTCRALAGEILVVRGVSPTGAEVGKAAARKLWAV